MKECQMSDHDRDSEMPTPAAQGGRARGRGFYVVSAVAGVALVGAFASSSIGQGLGHHLLAQVPGAMAAAPTGDGPGPGLGPELIAEGHGGFFDGIVEAVVAAHADRVVRHLAVEVDATAEQEDKLRAIVREAVKDLLPVREKIVAARVTARDLLTQQTVDRAAIEKFRTDLIATHDAVSKRVAQAVADAAEVLTPEQRRRIGDMVALRRAHWGGGPWGRGPWGHWGGWQN
jgi:periplasmic protein CpxP/Spy